MLDKIENLELDGPWDVIDNKSSVIAEGRKRPRIRGRPGSNVDGLLVINKRLQDSVFKNSGRTLNIILINQMAWDRQNFKKHLFLIF